MSKIVVISGGAAGAGAAYRLRQLGHENVVIIESKPSFNEVIKKMLAKN